MIPSCTILLTPSAALFRTRCFLWLTRKHDLEHFVHPIWQRAQDKNGGRGGTWTNPLRITFKQTNQICSCLVATAPYQRRLYPVASHVAERCLIFCQDKTTIATLRFVFAPHFMWKCRSSLKETLLCAAPALISLAAPRPFTAAASCISFSSSVASKDSLQRLTSLFDCN